TDRRRRARACVGPFRLAALFLRFPQLPSLLTVTAATIRAEAPGPGNRGSPVVAGRMPPGLDMATTWRRSAAPEVDWSFLRRTSQFPYFADFTASIPDDLPASRNEVRDTDRGLVCRTPFRRDPEGLKNLEEERHDPAVHLGGYYGLA